MNIFQRFALVWCVVLLIVGAMWEIEAAFIGGLVCGVVFIAIPNDD